MGVVGRAKFGSLVLEERKKKMKTWLVFNRRMDVVGTVRAESYNEAFAIAEKRFRYVEYIQEC